VPRPEYDAARMGEETKPRVLAVLTHRYSGSTLLAYVLSTHPDVATIGEGQRFYWKAFRTDREDAPEGAETCSCGEPFATCAYWQGIREELQASLPPEMLALDFTRFRFYHRDLPNRVGRALAMAFALRGKTHLLPPPLGSRYRRLAGANARLAAAVMRQRGGRLYLDTSKDAVSTILLARSPAVRGRLVHLIRDGRGQIHSALRRDPHLDLDSACRQWVEKTRMHLGILSKLGGDYLTLRYESFCADPEGVSREVFRYAGLAAERGSLDFRDETRHVMGNRHVRFGSTNDICDRQRWRDDFGPADLKTIDRIAGPLLGDLGYG